MKAVITKSFISSHLSHIFPKFPIYSYISVRKYHCVRCVARGRIATLPRGTRGIVNTVVT